MTQQSSSENGIRMTSTFKIASQIGVLSQWKSEKRGVDNSKEINRVSWNEKNPVIDIRSWWINDSGEKLPGKGITLNEKEARRLCQLLVACGYNDPAPAASEVVESSEA